MVTAKSYNQLEQRFRITPTKLIPIEVLHFDDERRVQEAESEEPTVLHMHFCRSSKISK